METIECGRFGPVRPFKESDDAVINNFNDIDIDLIYYIFTFLPSNVNSISEYALTCKKWHQILFHPRLISNLFFKSYPMSVGKYSRGELTREGLLKSIRFSEQLNNSFAPVKKSFFINSLKDNLDSVIDSYDCNNQGIVVLSNEGQKLLLINYDGKFIKIPMQDKLKCIRVTNNKIIGSESEILKILDFDGNVIKEIKAHEKLITVLLIEKEFIVTGSMDKTIKIWDLEGNLIQTLLGHSQAINAISTYNGQLISASDQEVILWNLHETSESLLFDHIKFVKALSINDDCFITGSSKWGTMDMWNLEGDHICFIANHMAMVSSLQIVDHKLVSSSIDGTIKIWDLRPLEWIHTLELEGGCKVKIFDEKLITGSKDGHIQIWDYSFKGPASSCALM